MSSTILKQQKINSLRRKDTMWIYKNPQGLLILEDELNERRKKRSARHRSSPPLPQNQPDTSQKQHRENHEKAVLISPAMKLESPKDVLIPIAKKAGIETKPNNVFIETPLKKSISDKLATPVIEKTDKQPQPTIIKRSLIEERSKLLALSSSNSSIPKETSKSTTKTKSTANLKQTAPQIKNRSTPATQDNNFLFNAKHKLPSVQQQQQQRKVESSSNKKLEPDSPVPPPRKRGLVSSFVSAFETSSPDILSPDKKGDTPTTGINVSKPITLAQIKPTTSQSYNHALPSRLVSNSPPPPIKPRRRSVMPSPSTTVSSPALATPYPFAAVASTDSYSHIIAVSPQISETKELKSSEPEIKISPSQTEIVPTSNEINVYLPQLSPEISFHENADMLEDVSADDEEEEYDDDDEPLDKEVASILVRPEIKKRVSFSEQLLTYIPEQQSSSDDDTSISSSEPIKSPILDFSRALNYELSDVKTKLIAERKVNTTPSRDIFVPAVVKKTEPEVIVPKRPSVANVNAPQKLSNKLLDMFQQKLSNPPIEQQVPVQSSKPQELVHLTKSRPRKPPSLKKPTYPAATAQPNWRIRATNRKYEFIA